MCFQHTMPPSAKPHYLPELWLETKWIDLFISCLNFIRGLTYLFSMMAMQSSSNGICTIRTMAAAKVFVLSEVI